MENIKLDTIAVVGLGYVGLPLALELSKYFSVKGYDTDLDRINDLKNNQNYIKTNKFENITDISIPILFENNIQNHAINFSDFNQDTFFVINKASYNDDNIELSTEIQLLSFENLKGFIWNNRSNLA